MDVAGFCRNCLSRWYREAAEELGAELSKDEARQTVYGMPYEEWKERHQTERGEEASAMSPGAARAGGATSS